MSRSEWIRFFPATTVGLTAYLVMLAPALVGCQPTEPTPRPSPALSVNADNVKQLCDFFEARPHEVLLTTQAEGNVNTLRDRDGVPRDLNEAARMYYNGETVPAVQVDVVARGRLDAKYATVIHTCEALGWRAG